MDLSAKELGLSIATAKRWLSAMEADNLVVVQDKSFTVTEHAEKLLSFLFRRQIQDATDLRA